MPAPPNFDNVWDITQPPDTQLANLLGQDIRNLKDDVMQRMSALSGLLANRPTPETVNATWGGAGFGLIYIATDANQIFQWTGSAWVPINIAGAGGTFLNEQGSGPVLGGNGAAQTFYTFNLLANTVPTNRSLRITTAWFATTAASIQYQLSLNGTSFYTFNSTGSGSFQLSGLLLNTGNPGFGEASSWYTNNGVIGNSATDYAAGNWAANQTLQVTFNVAGGGNTIAPKLWLVELV